MILLAGIAGAIGLGLAWLLWEAAHAPVIDDEWDTWLTAATTARVVLVLPDGDELEVPDGWTVRDVVVTLGDIDRGLVA